MQVKGGAAWAAVEHVRSCGEGSGDRTSCGGVY